MHVVYLSRRNLLTLLSKLDRKKMGDETLCTIIKNDSKNERFPQSLDSIAINAVEDEDYYYDRSPGPVHSLDEPKQ